MTIKRTFFFLLIFSSLTSFAQSNRSGAANETSKIPKHRYLAPGSILGYPAIDKTDIHVVHDAGGIPVYFWVLRYKGKTIGLQAANYAFYPASYKVTEVAEFPVYKDVFTSDEIVELLSTYKFKLEDNIIHIRTSKAKTKDGKVIKPNLPEFLKFTVEKLSFN